MHHTDIALVQRTWKQILPISDDAAQRFYSRLFEIDPTLRKLFAHSDMAEQRRKLMMIIGMAVRSLDSLDDLIPAVEALGRKHVAYGVTNTHYDTVASALIWTLEQGLGSAFTAQVRAAWIETYTILASVMQRGAQELAA